MNTLKSVEEKRTDDSLQSISHEAIEAKIPPPSAQPAVVEEPPKEEEKPVNKRFGMALPGMGRGMPPMAGMGGMGGKGNALFEKMKKKQEGST